MTTKVVKGSIWTLAGQMLPMFASLATTPIVIRLLGSENYGVLLLVGLIPNYFSFADFGMGMASTKFASEEYARGDFEAEARAVRSAAVIAFVCSCLFALPIAVFAWLIITQLNVPENLQWQAAWGLRMACGTFVVSILSNVVNTPQLSRLRMDLNAAINAASKVAASVGTVIVLYAGGGILGAAAFALVVATLGFVAHILVSGHLLRDFFGISLDRRIIRPMLRFGFGLSIAGIAAIFLINLEKLLVTRLISVQSLAYYSIAYTFANMAAMFSWAMVQSLIPAFSQLSTPDRQDQFNALFSRSIKLSIIWLLPTLMLLFVIARPFFTIWAGPDFGQESPGPFYILLAGLLFNIVAYVPYSSLVASGRTGLIAKIHSAELIPYAICAALLISYFGIIGAALAWSLRVIFDSAIFLWFARSVVGVHIEHRRTAVVSAFGLLVLSPSVLVAAFYNNYSPLLAITIPVSIALYLLIVWRYFVDEDERRWFVAKLPLQVRSLAVRITN
jgi:O-antigen/teichoic acid export membrane protein